MELAIHLRNVEQADGLDRLAAGFSSLIEQICPQEVHSGKAVTRSFEYIYVGDEFCPHRMPRPAELDALLDFSREHHKQVTLLTPPLTDAGIERLSPLLNRLRDSLPAVEVVGNDWGMLMFLKEEFPEFNLAAGRLLDKGFKDPRLSSAGRPSSVSEEMEAMLSSSSFDSPTIREKLIELGIVRIERDMFPYRFYLPPPSSRLSTSLYFPYGYITTGRVCWMSTFAGSSVRKFVPLDYCPRPCFGISTIMLGSFSPTMRVFQRGNTIYYLHAPITLERVFETAGREDIRLVYQGRTL